jgi:malate synthase
MTAPFMSAYTELLVRTCHRRGAHAIGGMAAFIPSRRDEAVNRVALAKVTEDKERESKAGFDGTWVAHPDLVPVARVPFDAALGDRPNQLDRSREDVSVRAEDLLDFTIPGAEVTDEGLHNDVAVGLRYLQAWLTGNGAAGIFNLMEDVATAEIARSQVWQWIQRGRFTDAQVRGVTKEEVDRIREEGGGDRRLDDAEALFTELALGRDYTEFLTLPAYEVLE